jgi:hypothetical protein
MQTPTDCQKGVKGQIQSSYAVNFIDKQDDGVLNLMPQNAFQKVAEALIWLKMGEIA